MNRGGSLSLSLILVWRGKGSLNEKGAMLYRIDSLCKSAENRLSQLIARTTNEEDRGRGDILFINEEEL